MADFEASSQLLRASSTWKGGGSVHARQRHLQSEVEQHLGPFLEAGALDELDINVVKAEGPKGRYKVQLSGIPDAPEGPVSLSDAKDRIIAWARTRQAAVPQGEAPAAHAVEEMLDQLRAMVAESILDPASRQLLALVRDMQAAVAAAPGQEVPPQLASFHQLLQRVEAKLLFHGAGCVAAPFGLTKTGKSHLLSLLVGGLLTHLCYELLPPQHTNLLMDRAGLAYIRSELRHVPQDILEQRADDLTVTIKLPASYLQADPEEEGILSVTLERQRNMEMLGEYQKTGELGDAYQSWLASQTDMPTTQVPYALAWGDTHQVVLAVVTREEALEMLLEVQRLADMLLTQAAAGASKARKKGAGSSRGAASLLQDLQTDGLPALKQHLLASNPTAEVKEGFLSALGRYRDLCGPQLQWDEDRPQLDKKKLQMKPDVEQFLNKFAGKFINCSSWPGAPSDSPDAADAWQRPQGLAHAADAFMCGVLRVVQGCAKPESAVRRLCLPALLEAGIPEGLLTSERGKAPPICALLKSAVRFCPSETLAGGLTFLELPGTGVNNAQHKAHAREALSRRITHPVCMFHVEADEGMLEDIQRNYLTHALVDILEGAASRRQDAPAEEADAGRLHLAERLAVQRREPLLVSCLEAKGITLGDGSGTSHLVLDTVTQYLGALTAKEVGNQDQALQTYQEDHLDVLLSNVDRLLGEGGGAEACIKWLKTFARRGPLDDEEEEGEGEESSSEGAEEGEEDAAAAEGGEDDSSDDDDSGEGGGGSSGINRRTRAIMGRMARAAVRGPGLQPAVAKLRRKNAKAQLRRLLCPPAITVYPSLLFSHALNPGHAATLAAAGANVDEAVNHITSGMAQLVGHLTSATPEQLQEVVEELLTGLDQHMAALGSTVKGMQKWKLPRPYVNRRVRQAGQAGAAKAPGPNPSDAGEGEWRDAAIAIDAFCSGTATAVPSAGAQLTKVVLRQKLIEQVKSLGQRALDRVADGQVAADVRSMGQALQQQFKDPRQRLHQFNRALGLQRSSVGRDPRFDVMSLLRDEVFRSQQEGAQLLGALLGEVEGFALETLADVLVERLLRDFQTIQPPGRYLTPEVKAALYTQLLEAARAQLQDAVNKFNVVGNNAKVLSAQEIDRHLTQVLEGALQALFSEAREAAIQAAGGGGGNQVAAGDKKRARATTRNPGQQVEAMLTAVEEGLPEVVQQVVEELADCLWGTISRGVGAFGDALGWGASLRRKNTKRQMLLLTQHYNELVRKLRDITVGGARTKKRGMHASLADWRARFLTGWKSAKQAAQKREVDSDLLSRLATSSARLTLPRAQGINTQHAQDLLQALGKASAAAVQRAPVSASKHAAAAWKQRATQPPAAAAAAAAAQREEQQEAAELHRGRLSSILDQQGLQLVHTLGNGQCLANSLLTVLHGGQLPPVVLQHHATQLVRMALGRLRELYRRDAEWRTQIGLAVTEAGFSCFQDYIDAYMEDPHTWGDHLLLQGMIEELGIAVVLYTSTPHGVDATPLWPSTVDDWTASQLSPHVIAFGEPVEGMGHYEAVLPKPAPQQQPEEGQLAQDEQVDEEEEGEEEEEEEEPVAVPSDLPAAMEVDEANAAAAGMPAVGEPAQEAVPAPGAGAAAAAAAPAVSGTFRADKAAVASPPVAAAGPSQPAAAAGKQPPTKAQRLIDLCDTLMPVLRQVAVTRGAAAKAAAAAAAVPAALQPAQPDPTVAAAGQEVAAPSPAAHLQAYSPTAAAAEGAARYGRLNLQQQEGMRTRSMVQTGGYSRQPLGLGSGPQVIVVLHDTILSGGTGQLHTLRHHLQARCRSSNLKVLLHRPLYEQLQRVWGGPGAAPWERELLPLLQKPHSRQSGASWALEQGQTNGLGSEECAACGPVVFAQEMLVGETAEGRDAVVLLVVGGPSAALLRTTGTPPDHRYAHLHPELVPPNEVAVDLMDLQQALLLLDPEGPPDVAAAVREAPANTYKLIPRLADGMSLYVRKPRVGG